jgi:DtxR family Mn-dependent transcriptional regulator
MPSMTVENYLKHILLLSARPADLVPMGALAGALGVVPGTVTTMVKMLAAEGLAEHHVREGVRLTPAGRKLALNVLRKHRLVETFLVQILKMDWTEVHAEAERLEHAVSDRVLDRLDALLGHPPADPHGDPIPSRAGELDTRIYATLATCPPDLVVRVVRVTDQSDDFLQFILKNQLAPGAELEVVGRDLSAGIIRLRRPRHRELTLSLAAAGKISVVAHP